MFHLVSDALWYAVRTRSRSEKVVREQLLGRGIEPLLPLISRVSQWKDRRKRIEWPLFPGYCFARFHLEQKLTVLQTPGVVSIIGSALGTLEPIPDREIEALQRVIESHYPYDPYPGLAPGTEVEVVRGPLMGLRGVLMRKGNGSRLVVSINLIQQGAAVEINAADLVAVHEAAV